MKTTFLFAICFLSSAASSAQTIGSSQIDPSTFEGKQIKVLNPALANKLFEPHSVDHDSQIVLAEGQLQTQEAAKSSGAAVLCQFVAVPVRQNGYLPLFSDSKLEVKKVDSHAILSRNLLQLTFTVHHDSFSTGYEHLDRQFSCFNQPGTIFGRAELGAAFGTIFAFE